MRPVEQIRFCHRQQISFADTDPWSVLAHEQSWFETRLQMQRYEEFRPQMSFSDFLKLPDADQIHSRVSPSVRNLLTHFNGRMPGLTDVWGDSFELQQFRFEILDTDFENRSKHRFNLWFYTAAWLQISDSSAGILVADPALAESFASNQEIPTRLVKLPDHVAISHIQKI